MFRSVRFSPGVFSEVLAARKTNLNTACARKERRSARVLANARKDHSISLLNAAKSLSQGPFKQTLEHYIIISNCHAL